MRWAADNLNWELQLAIADLAGGDWPKLARRAAIKLACERREPSEGKRLLAAFRDLFSAHGSVLASAEVQKLLIADPSNEWVDFRSRGRPISQREVARLLDAYDLHPTYIHRGLQLAIADSPAAKPSAAIASSILPKPSGIIFPNFRLASVQPCARSTIGTGRGENSARLHG